MLTISDRRFAHSPSILDRRDFLRIGSLCGLTLPGLLAAKARAATRKNVYKNKSVVFLFLQGGLPQHVTFDGVGMMFSINSFTKENCRAGFVRPDGFDVWRGKKK